MSNKLAGKLSTYELFGDGLELVKFNELEEKIRYIVQEQAQLRKRNEELEELLKKRELELNETNLKIRGLYEERDSIRTKVDSLLDLLQDISTPA